MEKNRQISCAESQIIYMDNLPSRRVSVTLLMWAVHSDFLPKSPVWKGGKQSTTSQRGNLTNTTSARRSRSTSTATSCQQNEKKRNRFQQRGIPQTPARASSKQSSHQNTKKSKQLSQSRGARGDRLTRCHVSWMGSCREKRHQGKLRKCEWSIAFIIIYEYWLTDCNKRTILR